MTVLDRSVGYPVRGTTRLVVIPASLMSDGVLDTAALTSATTVDVTNDAGPSISGFSGDQGELPDPDLGSQQTGALPGEITFANSSLTFRLSKSGPADDIRAVLHTGDEVYLLIADQGLAAGKTCDLVHATVKYGTKQREDVARIMIPFSIHEVRTDVIIPALV
jgi:hypothetical protein